MTARPLLALLSTSCFASFAWGVGRHFARSSGMPVGMRAVSALSLAGFVDFAAALARRREPARRVLPASMMLSSLLLFWWAVRTSGRSRLALAFDGAAPTELLATGPWRHVRHPFYLSYLVFWTATAIAIGRARAWLPVLTFGALYTAAARAEERRFAASVLDRDYAAYRSATPMFVPVRILRAAATLWGSRNGVSAA